MSRDVLTFIIKFLSINEGSFLCMYYPAQALGHLFLPSCIPQYSLRKLHKLMFEKYKLQVPGNCVYFCWFMKNTNSIILKLTIKIPERLAVSIP